MCELASIARIQTTYDTNTAVGRTEVVPVDTIADDRNKPDERGVALCKSSIIDALGAE